MSFIKPAFTPMMWPREVSRNRAMPHLVGDAALAHLLLGLADGGDLRHRVDAVGKNSAAAAAARSKAWQAAIRPCSIEVEARLGKPMTSPAA